METPMNFDPMTGQPLTPEAQKMVSEAAQPQYQAMPQYQSQVPQPKKTNIGLIIAICGIALAAIIAIILIFVLILGGSGKSKVQQAAKNTLEEWKNNNTFFEVLDFSDISKSKEQTVVVDIDTEISSVGDMSIRTEVASDGKKAQAFGDVEVAGLPAIDYVAELNEEELKVSVPLLNNYVFVYDYRSDDNNGYLMDAIDSETVGVINEMLINVYTSLSSKSNGLEESSKKMQDSLHLSELKFNKLKSAKFEIDDKEVNCKGYSVLLTKEYMGEVLDDYKQIFEENFADLYDSVGVSVEDAMDTLNDELDEVDDIEVKFYIYKKQLAAIELVNTEDESTLSLLFKGGDYRAQNISFAEDGSELLAIEGNNSNNTEEMSFKVDGEELFSYKFDTDINKLTFNYSDGWDEFSLNMTINKDKDKLVLDFGTIDLGDSYIEGKLTFEKGCEFKDFDDGKEFNVGTADESDFESLITDLSTVLYGLF